MKFTFKTEKITGKWAWLGTPMVYIKYNKVEVGSIVDESPFKISMKVYKNNINEDNNPNCKWKWIRFEKKSETLEEAKEFLNKNIKEIFEKHKIVLE